MEDDSCCIGCAAYKSVERGRNCSSRQFNHKGDCPCVDCIIKMMCSAYCPLRFKWRRFIMSQWTQEDKNGR